MGAFNVTGTDMAPGDAWDGIIRQVTLAGFLKKKTEEFGVLNLTEAGREFLENPVDFTLYKDKGLRVRTAEPASAGGALDQPLLDMLHALRKEESTRLELPPFVIFSDPSLEEMATHYPTTPDELLRITGVGSGKAAKYGAPFLALIAEHVEAEGIEKSEAMLVRSSAAKSKHKVAIIQLLDRKLGLTDIAAGIHGNRDMVLDEIEKIVGAGTKLNLDHILEESLDEECLEELFDFFSESEDDGLASALEEFDDAYSEEELRLAKITFMSEVAH